METFETIGEKILKMSFVVGRTYMQYRFSPYLWISLLLMFILISLIMFAWKRRSEKSVPYFLLTLILAFVWVTAQAMEIASVNLATKLIWANIVYLPSTAIPVTYFYLALYFVGLEKWIRKRWLQAVTLMIPITFNILLWSNNYHELIRRNVYLDTSENIPVISKSYGPFFWFYAYYNIVLTIVTLIILIRDFRNKNRLQKAQVLSLFWGLLLPACSVCVYISKIFPIRIDPTPMTIGVSSIIISLGIYRYHLFDVISIAHSIIIKEMNTGLIIMNNEGEVLEINPAARDMLNIRLIRQDNAVDTILRTYPDLIELYKNKLSSITEIAIKGQESINYYEVSFKMLSNSKQLPIGWILQIYDITMRKLEEERIKEIAAHDSLTGLINRSRFEKMFDEAKEEAKKSGSALVVAYMDLDDFKLVNDTYGHDVGDALLKNVTDRLKMVLDGKGIISRYGGDEFTILFPIDNDEISLDHISELVSDTLVESMDYNNISIAIKASIGFSVYPKDGESLELLIKQADKNMYAIKRSKKSM